MIKRKEVYKLNIEPISICAKVYLCVCIYINNFHGNVLNRSKVWLSWGFFLDKIETFEGRYPFYLVAEDPSWPRSSFHFTKFHFAEIWFVFVRPTLKVVRGAGRGAGCQLTYKTRQRGTGKWWYLPRELSLSLFSFKFHLKKENIKYSTYFNSCLKKISFIQL